MEVVRGDAFQPGGLRHLVQLTVQLYLRHAAVRGDALVLHLNVEVARSKAAGEFLRPLHGIFELAVVQQARDDTRHARRCADEAFTVFLQHLERRARLVVEVVHMRFGHQMQQVVIAHVVLRKQDHVVQRRLALALQLGIRGEVDLATVDGLHVLARLLLHLLHAVRQLRHAAHDAVVRDGDGGHVAVRRLAHHLVDVRGAVEQGVFRVIVQMNESHVPLPLIRFEAKEFHCAFYQPAPCALMRNPSVPATEHTVFVSCMPRREAANAERIPVPAADTRSPHVQSAHAAAHTALPLPLRTRQRAKNGRPLAGVPVNIHLCAIQAYREEASFFASRRR